MGDAVSHAVLPGVVLAYVLGLPLALGAFAAGMACAVGTGWLKENSRIKEDALLGVVFSGMFALGIVLYTSIETDLHLDHILFGNMLGASAADLAQSAVIALMVTAVIGLRWKDLLLHAFDHGLRNGLARLCRTSERPAFLVVANLEGKEPLLEKSSVTVHVPDRMTDRVLNLRPMRALSAERSPAGGSSVRPANAGSSGGSLTARKTWGR
jgi:hypothetical protein